MKYLLSGLCVCVMLIGCWELYYYTQEGNNALMVPVVMLAIGLAAWGMNIYLSDEFQKDLEG